VGVGQHRKPPGVAARGQSFRPGYRPGAKIASAERLANSFLTEEERAGLEYGVGALNPDNEGTAELQAFVSAARARLLRIYAAWWGSDGLNIDHLTQATPA